MSDGPWSGSPPAAPPRRLLGVLRAWLQTLSSGPAPAQTVPALRASQDGQVPTVPNVQSPARRPRGPLRVLVADDDPVNRMLAAARLRAMGLQPMLAADGAEAVALACELHFDLVLMDLQMPVLDGLGATRAIRRFETASQRPAVPVVAHSSATPAAGILAQHGLDGSLGKPCTDAAFEGCVLRWCHAGRGLPERRNLPMPWRAPTPGPQVPACPAGPLRRP